MKNDKMKIKIFANKSESKKDQLKQFLKLSRKQKKKFLNSFSKMLAKEFNQEYKLIKINEYIKRLKDGIE